MAKSHQQLLDFQISIIQGLKLGEDHKLLAERSRGFIKDFYGFTLPNGAELGIDVNNSCNLRCKHCYYANTHLRTETEENALSEDEWKGVINQAVNIGMTHMNIIGKEPLKTPEKTKAILSELERQRQLNPLFRYELLTNGTLIQPNIDWLSQFPDFYFFNISFDGFEEAHDSVRGDGNYKRAREGLRLAKEAGIKRLSSTFTAMPHNVGSLDLMLDDLTSLGLEYLSVGFCFPTEFNSAKFYSNEKVFYETLRKLESAPENLDISVNLMGDEHAELIAKLVRGGFFKRLAVTEDHGPSLIHILKEDNPRTAVQINVLPVMFYSGFRLDYDGTAMDFCAEHQTQERKGFGNVKQCSLEELYKISREKLWKGYTEQFFERLSQAFQGEELGPIRAWY